MTSVGKVTVKVERAGTGMGQVKVRVVEVVVYTVNALGARVMGSEVIAV